MGLWVIKRDDPRVAYLEKKDKRLSTVFDAVGDIVHEDFSDGYSFVVQEIVGQMISGHVAEILCNRLVNLCGGEITPKTISRFPASELRNIGLSRPKCQYILGFTEAVLSGELVLADLESLSDADAKKRLLAVKGIGNWTAQMYLLCVLKRDDILPTGDKAFLAAYKWLYETEDVSRAAVEKRCAKWSPYSSVATLYMYHANAYGLLARPWRELKKELAKKRAAR